MTNLNIRIDSETKEKAEKIFKEHGLNMSIAVNMFLKQTIREQGIPFKISLNIPNETTIQAIEEGRLIARDKNVKGFKSTSELFKELDNDLWN